MKKAKQALEQLIKARSNDYTSLEEAYFQVTGGELVRDPYRSIQHVVPNLTFSASIIIPAYNARSSLERCLLAIEQSSFHRKYPNQLEVIVVDDGSTDGTWKLLEELRPAMHFRGIQQDHFGISQARNTGIAVAEGDVIVCCDADIILTPFSIEELVKRHQVLDSVLLIGFREGVDEADQRMQPTTLAAHLPGLLPSFMRDNRLNFSVFGHHGWPSSIRDFDHLKRLGKGKQIILPNGATWDLCGGVFGFLMSLRRSDLIYMGGFEERFSGWGNEDVLAGVRGFAMDDYIVPVYSATGFHILHQARSPKKKEEYEANEHLYREILQEPFEISDGKWQKHAKDRIKRHFEKEPVNSSVPTNLDSSYYTVFDSALADPVQRGEYFFSLGRYDEAAAAFAEMRGTAIEEAWAVFNQARALHAAKHYQQSISLLEGVKRLLPSSPLPLIEIALALAAQDQFEEAHTLLMQAQQIEPTNPLLAFLLHRSVDQHVKRASLYASQGDYDLALRDYEAALMLEPKNAAIRYSRAIAMEK